MLLQRAIRESPRFFVLILVIVLLWVAIYKRRESLGDPISYIGDSTFIYAIVKAVQEGDVGLFGSKEVSRLGAPFGANWNDIPWTEDFIYYLTGLLARFIGVPEAVNIAFLAAFVLAGCSFYLVGRYLRWRWQWCFAGAVLYGCSYYLIRRGVDHFNIVFYWACPLWLLVCWWSAARSGIRLFGRKFFASIVIALFTAWNNPYYASVFLQLLTLSIAARLLRGYTLRSCMAPAAIGATCILLVLSMHLDTFFYQLDHGRNSAAIARSLNELELYALRPVDLFLPYFHRIVALQTFTRDYGARTALYGELGTTYLGVIGGISLLVLFGAAFKELAKGPGGRVNGLASQALWTLLYSVAGSFNMILGLAGIYLFRSMNRVSIVLLALALFHSVRGLSRLTYRWSGGMATGVAALVTAIGIWDQTLDYNPDHRAEDRKRIKSDRNFGRRLDEKLPRGAMLFQLPTMRFPDAPGIHKMPGYDHLRPYIFSTHVRFSHGDNSGRAAERWRNTTARLNPSDLIEQLERAGFAGVLINTTGYEDAAAALIARLAEDGRAVVLRSKRGDFALVRLQPHDPAIRPPLPPEEPIFREGWHAPESDQQNAWRWSSGNAKIGFTRPAAPARATDVTFQLTGGNRTVDIRADGRLLRRVEFRGDKVTEDVSLRLEWPSGVEKIVLEFSTDAAAIKPMSSDPRLLAFCLYNLSQTESPDR